jgi:hypothetical protein
MLQPTDTRTQLFFAPERLRRGDVTEEALAAAEYVTDFLRERYQAAEKPFSELTPDDKTWLRSCSWQLLEDFELALAEQIVVWHGHYSVMSDDGWLRLLYWGSPSIPLKSAAEEVATFGILLYGWQQPLNGHCVWIKPGRVDVQ